MALPPGNPDIFMREVDDAVRADQAQEFVRRFGKPIVVLVIAGLLGLAGWLYWDSHSASVDGAKGAQLSAALETFGQNRPKAASTALEPLSKSDNPSYRALALMVQGNAAVSQGDMRAAAAKFADVAADPTVDQSLRNAALVRQMLAEFDSVEPTALIARLRHLVAQPGPAFASAAELTALAEMKRGNDAAAAALFKRISETEVAPDSLKRRAVQMAGMLGVDAVGDAGSSGAEAAPASADQASNKE